ncbi:MAG: DEAD/DEAH box helicase [Gemmataceae bacterium]
MRLADLGAKLIFADRSDAAEWDPDFFTPEQAKKAILAHEKACATAANKAREAGASKDLLRARDELQDHALRKYRDHPDGTVFTLLLPTGYGKTLTGLRIALEAVATGRCKRLIYVAPYISILSQAAAVIRDATGINEVFLHHHLSILGTGDNDAQREDHQRYDLLDTWQAPIVATTFNQLFRALFPARAQECLRIPALDEGFVFIDEPQVVDPGTWCAFLRAMSVAASERRCQVLFATATLPPLEDGLGVATKAVSLADDVRPAVGRYVITTTTEPWNTERVRREVTKAFDQTRSVAVILNTVRDAVDVFNGIAGKPNPNWFFLAAMMLPGHKARIIAEIKHRLDPKNSDGRPTGVACTQILEAGVDLSFRALFRATPIFSSIAQSAGRANRHGEGKLSEVVVFPFCRDDGTDSRKFVYRDSTFVPVTDAVLAANPRIDESELPQVMAEFYKKCWAENARTESLGWFGRAAHGEWTALAGREPFGGDYPRIDVLVPFAESFLADHHRRILESFGVKTAGELLDGYAQGDLISGIIGKDLFIRRKQLSALLQQFTVAVPLKIADRDGFSEEVRDRFGNPLWLRRLCDGDAYGVLTGFARIT